MIFLRNSWDITRQQVSNLDVIVNEMNKKFEVSERGVRDFVSCAPSGDASAFLCRSPGTSTNPLCGSYAMLSSVCVPQFKVVAR